MPLWKVYHPVGAFTAEDKAALAKRVTEVYAMVPIPRFYVVFIYEEIAKDSCFVGGELNNKFVRFKVDHIARTLPGQVLREWWIRTLDTVIAPYVKDRGYDWEISVDETPFDLWSLQGELPPPFESVAEKRWVKENRASPYTVAEKIPVNLILAPGVADRGESLYRGGEDSCQSHSRTRSSGPLGVALAGRSVRRVVPKRDDDQQGNVIFLGTNFYIQGRLLLVEHRPLRRDRNSSRAKPNHSCHCPDKQRVAAQV